MSRLETRKNEHISKVVDEESEGADAGQESTTEYRVLKTNEDINCALVEFVPKTGRTHQIRLHASHIGCPIVGDRKYGGNLQMCKKLNLVAQKILLPSNIHSGWLEVENLPDFFVIQE